MAWVRVRDRQSNQVRVISEGVAKSLRDRFEILTEGVDQVDEVVSSEDAKPSVPNVTAAPANVVEVAANESNDELEKARKRYEELYEGKPHGRTRLETLLKLIAEKENAK